MGRKLASNSLHVISQSRDENTFIGQPEQLDINCWINSFAVHYIKPFCSVQPTPPRPG